MTERWTERGWLIGGSLVMVVVLVVGVTRLLGVPAPWAALIVGGGLAAIGALRWAIRTSSWPALRRRGSRP